MVRRFKDEDLDYIVELENLFIAPYKKEELLREIKENETSNILVYEENGVVIGFIDFWITFDSATICQIAVRKDRQREGIAKKLFDESIKVLKDNNVISYTLEVREQNLIAYNFYIKNDFVKVKLKEKYYTNGDNAIYMVRGIY